MIQSPIKQRIIIRRQQGRVSSSRPGPLTTVQCKPRARQHCHEAQVKKPQHGDGGGGGGVQQQIEEEALVGRGSSKRHDGGLLHAASWWSPSSSIIDSSFKVPRIKIQTMGRKLFGMKQLFGPNLPKRKFLPRNRDSWFRRGNFCLETMTHGFKEVF